MEGFIVLVRGFDTNCMHSRIKGMTIPETAPVLKAEAAPQTVTPPTEKAGMLKALYERTASRLSRLFASGKKAADAMSDATEGFATKLYDTASPQGKPLEQLSPIEVAGNLATPIGRAVESGANAAANKIDATLNPENKDYMQMPMTEILGNMAAPVVEKMNAAANKIDTFFNPEGKDYEQMSMGEILKGAKEFFFGKKQARETITAERSVLTEQVAALEAAPTASALETAKSGIASLWGKLSRYGRMGYDWVTYGGAEIRAQYEATTNGWKTYTLEKDAQKYEQKLAVIRRKQAMMESFAKKTGTEIELPAAREAAPATAA